MRRRRSSRTRRAKRPPPRGSHRYLRCACAPPADGASLDPQAQAPALAGAEGEAWTPSAGWQPRHWRWGTSWSVRARRAAAAPESGPASQAGRRCCSWRRRRYRRWWKVCGGGARPRLRLVRAAYIREIWASFRAFETRPAACVPHAVQMHFPVAARQSRCTQRYLRFFLSRGVVTWARSRASGAPPRPPPPVVVRVPRCEPRHVLRGRGRAPHHPSSSALPCPFLDAPTATAARARAPPARCACEEYGRPCARRPRALPPRVRPPAAGSPPPPSAPLASTARVCPHRTQSRSGATARPPAAASRSAAAGRLPTTSRRLKARSKTSASFRPYRSPFRAWCLGVVRCRFA